MKVTAFIYGCVMKPNHVGFAVHMEDQDGNTHCRIVPLNLKSTLAAELSALNYICHSIPDPDKVELTVTGQTKTLAGLFEKTSQGSWKRKSKTSGEVVASVRSLSEEFKSFQCLANRQDKTIKSLKDLVKKALFLLDAD